MMTAAHCRLHVREVHAVARVTALIFQALDSLHRVVTVQGDGVGQRGGGFQVFGVGHGVSLQSREETGGVKRWRAEPQP